MKRKSGKWLADWRDATGKPKRKAFSTQAAGLHHAASPAMRCAILLASHGGLRASDSLRIAPIHYNAEARKITIDQKKTGTTVVLPVTDELAAILNAAPTAENPRPRPSIVPNTFVLLIYGR